MNINHNNKINIDTSDDMNISDNVNRMILINIINNKNIDTSKIRWTNQAIMQSTDETRKPNPHHKVLIKRA